MTHRADQIIEAIVAAVRVQTSALQVQADNVFSHRTLSLADDAGLLPAITVNFADDTPVSEFGADNVSFIDSVLGITIESFAVDPEEQAVRRALLNHRRFIHKALMADQALGLPFVIGTRYAGAAKPELDGTTELAAGALESRWAVHYRMNISDPGD